MISIAATKEEDIDSCIKSSLAILNNLSFYDTSNLLKYSYTFDAILLSKISTLDKALVSLIDNSIDIIVENYIVNFGNKVSDISNTTASIEVTESYKNIIDNATDSATVLMDKLIIANNIQPASINLSSTFNDVENTLMTLENLDNNIFNFIESKSLINDMLNILRHDVNEFSNLKSESMTTYATYVIKINSIIESRCSIIQGILDLELQTQQLIDACRIALLIMNDICNASNDKLIIFLGREYPKIKQDILLMIG